MEQKQIPKDYLPCWRSGVTVAGVEFNNNTALTTQSERRFLDSKADWRNCGWSETQQLHSRHNTKRTMIWMLRNLSNFRKNRTNMRRIKDVKTCRIFAIKIRKRGTIRGEMAKLWLEWNYDNNTVSTKTGTQSQQGRKIRGPS